MSAPGEGSTAPSYAKSALYSAIYGAAGSSASTSTSSADGGAAQGSQSSTDTTNTIACAASDKPSSQPGASAPAAWSTALRFAPRARTSAAGASSSSAASSSGTLARSRSIPTSLAIKPTAASSSSSSSASALPSSSSMSALSSSAQPAGKTGAAFQPSRSVLAMGEDEDDTEQDAFQNLSSSRSAGIKMPKLNAPAARAKPRPGADLGAAALAAALPPPVSSVHGRPAAQRYQDAAPANVPRHSTKSTDDAGQKQDLRRPRPLPSFGPPPMTLSEQEMEEDKEIVRMAAERRGDFPGGPGRWQGDEEDEEDSSMASGKRRWKKKKRKMDAPALNMDADYDPRLPNDYAAFRALLRERRQAERELARQRRGDDEEEWLSDEEDDLAEEQRRHEQEEEEERRADEHRRKMMRFAPPSSYGPPEAAPLQRVQQLPPTTMTYAQRAGLEPLPEPNPQPQPQPESSAISDPPPFYPGGLLREPPRQWTQDAPAFYTHPNAGPGFEQNSPRDFHEWGYSRPNDTRPPAPRGFAPAPVSAPPAPLHQEAPARTWNGGDDGHANRTEDQPPAPAVDISDAVERARRIAQALTSKHNLADDGRRQDAPVPGLPPEPPHLQSSATGTVPPPVAAASSVAHIHPSRLAQMQADTAHTLDSTAPLLAPEPAPAPGPPPPPPPLPPPQLSQPPQPSSAPPAQLRFEPSSDPRKWRPQATKVPPQSEPSTDPRRRPAQLPAPQLSSTDQQAQAQTVAPPPLPPPAPPAQAQAQARQEEQDRPAWNADKTGVVARLMAQMGHRQGEGIGADGNQGILAPLRVSAASTPGKKKDASNSNAASASDGAGAGAGMMGKRGTIHHAGARGGGTNASHEQARFGEPSEVVLLENMVGEDGVDEHLGDEIREECLKFGRVARVFIFPTGNPALGVRIFVAFEGPAAAWQAVHELDGRLFGGRQVRARYYARASFQRGAYLETL
ncbi:hypothetical protein OC834_004278 [Tilletia horrida]|nr:hypothetical protein OC834_004278 [Tilletia horrida]